MRKTSRKHRKSSKKPPKIAPGGLRKRSCEPVRRLEPPKTAQGAPKPRQESARSGPERLLGPFVTKNRNLAIMEREARETEERQALQARREQREQEEQQETERQNHIEEQGESGESRPRIETASPYDRLCPSSPAARARRAV